MLETADIGRCTTATGYCDFGIEASTSGMPKHDDLSAIGRDADR